MSSEKHIHIVSFNVPYPPDYGGIIDVFYKVKSLTDAGVKVHLHCFQYGREEAKELEAICHKVYYYRRKIYKDPLFSRQPYIVITRDDPRLLANLCKDNHPILLEGIHCCYYLGHPALKGRHITVRMHNLEHLYYKNLARVERNRFKRYFFSVEAVRIKRFESALQHATAIAAISPEDTRLLKLKHDNVYYLPVFHGHSEVQPPLDGRGKYALYHGNLSVGENNEAAVYLVKEVFNDISCPLIIAGNNPSSELKKLVMQRSNIKLISKSGPSDMEKLIREAQVNVLPTFQSTGIKLKLLNALFNGRHCLVNNKMVNNTGLEPLCSVAQDARAMKELALELKDKPLDYECYELRKRYLEENFNNELSVQILLDHIAVAEVN